MADVPTKLLSGNEAVAAAARACGVHLGTGYPGTPSTEILENFALLEGPGTAQWCPNEKVALEVGLGAAFAGARVVVTMKHVGVNVAADPLFTAAHTGVVGGLVLVAADDPGMHSSQNEQDTRHFARAAGVPMFEPADSQEAYDYFDAAMRLSEQFQIPVLLRVTTRVCHSKSLVELNPLSAPAREIGFQRDPRTLVMIPAYAKSAHVRLREKLNRIASCAAACELATTADGDGELGIITSGVAYQHAREADPDASILKLGLTWPLPMETIRDFVDVVGRCVVIEEGDDILARDLRAAGLAVQNKPEPFEFGELTVPRVQAILAGEATDPPAPETTAKPKPPQLCPGCPHRTTFELLRDRGCIVAGDIGCYTLGTLPPFNAMDTCVCMGASIGVGLGLRRVLPAEQASKVVSVIGDSTFMHSGLTGLADMVYNGPAHLVLILDNATTAMTGLQEHPGTGRSLSHQPAGQVVLEDACRGLGVHNVHIVDPMTQRDQLAELIDRYLAEPAPAVIIARRTCLLAAGKIRQYEKASDDACQDTVPQA